MHILIVPSWYPKYPGDVQGCFFREQALALKKYGHDVGVIDIKFRLPRSFKSVFNGFFGIDCEVDEGLQTYHFCGFDWFRRIPSLQRWSWLRCGIKLFERYISQHGKPDVLHAHSMFNGGVLACIISERFDIPFVVTEHCSVFALSHVSLKQLELARGVSASAVRCFAVSNALCKELEYQLDGGAKCWEEMPNIVSQKFLDVELPIRTKSRMPFVFLSVSLLTENKAIHNLVTAFSRAFENDQDTILKIGGHGVERARLEALALELDVVDRVKFVGMLNREQVREELSDSNVFVLSSHYETFGVVVIEALALGKPVIATRCGGPDSIVREQDGVLVPTDDVQALVEAMKNMLVSYAKYDATEIRASCISRYSERVIAQRLNTVYSNVLLTNERASK